MPCPYAKRRGVVVFCEVLGKNVNPLVMPCLSDRYERCPHYQRRKREEARIVAERKPEAPAPMPAGEPREAAAPAPTQPVEKPPPPPALSSTAREEGAVTAAAPTAEGEEEETTVVEARPPRPQPPPAAVGAEEAPRAPPAPTGWSEAESERLADPVTISQIILRAPLTARLRVEAEKLDEMLERVGGAIREWKDRCFIIDMRSAKGQAYVKVCRGEPVAAATIGMPLKREELEELVEGTLELRVYGPLTE